MGCISRYRHRTVPPQPHRTSHSKDQLSSNNLISPLNMRIFLLTLCLLAVAMMTSGQQYQQQRQTLYNRYDNFNADSIIQNDRVLLAYYKCVMDKGPCTKDGKNFKTVLPETLTTACGRCSPQQKAIVRKLLLGIRAKSEPRYLELLDKYDPQRVNRDALYSFLITGNSGL